MSDLHECLGVRDVGDKTVICACVSQTMYRHMESYFRAEFIKEIHAFASEYHHHIEGRDVVIAEQLVTFLQPVKGEG